MTQQASVGSVNQDGLSGWWRAYLRRRYAVLFYSLLLTLVAGPILKAIGITEDFLPLFLAINLLATTVPIESRKGHWVLPAIVVLAAVLIKMWSLQVDHLRLSTAGLILWTGVGLYAVFAALRFALRSSIIASEHLYAALSAYLLAGVFLGELYWSLQRMWPNSIIVSGAGTSHPFSLTSGIYFSFITLATVGYGDFVPGNDVVRGLAVVEAIAGQFYLAVMIARLMSLYMREAR
jgi:voltage-gated potassium channel